MMDQLADSFITELENYAFSKYGCLDDGRCRYFRDVTGHGKGIDIVIDIYGNGAYETDAYDDYEVLYNILDDYEVIHLHSNDLIFGYRHYDELLEDAKKEYDKYMEGKLND